MSIDQTAPIKPLSSLDLPWEEWTHGPRFGTRYRHLSLAGLGKGYRGEDFVDVIFSSGNGVARVDEEWFERAVAEEVLGYPTRLIPAEEMIWSKAFVQERERFDGADIAHLIRSRGEGLDWERLLRRFGRHWRAANDLGHADARQRAHCALV